LQLGRRCRINGCCPLRFYLMTQVTQKFRPRAGNAELQMSQSGFGFAQLENPPGLPQFPRATTMLRRASAIPLSSRLACWPVLKNADRLSPLVWRGYSTASPSIADLSAASVTVEKTSSPKALTPQSELVFGHTFTGRLH